MQAAMTISRALFNYLTFTYARAFIISRRPTQKRGVGRRETRAWIETPDSVTVLLKEKGIACSLQKSTVSKYRIKSQINRNQKIIQQ